jgi:hypothetical protein
MAMESLSLLAKNGLPISTIWSIDRSGSPHDVDEMWMMQAILG